MAWDKERRCLTLRDRPEVRNDGAINIPSFLHSHCIHSILHSPQKSYRSPFRAIQSDGLSPHFLSLPWCNSITLLVGRKHSPSYFGRLHFPVDRWVLYPVSSSFVRLKTPGFLVLVREAGFASAWSIIEVRSHAQNLPSRARNPPTYRCIILRSLSWGLKSTNWLGEYRKSFQSSSNSTQPVRLAVEMPS